MDRSEIALKFVQAETTVASIDNLPFAKDEFDLVTSLECIEHLPVKIYEKGLSELCRVSRRYIIISVPSEENLKRNMVECPYCTTNFHSCYHMRSFNEFSIKSLFEPFGFKCIHIEKMGVAYFLSDFLNYWLRNKKQNPGYISIPCPVCGYELPPSKTSQFSKDSKNLLKKFWPQKSCKRWIVGLYSKIDNGHH